MKILLIVLSTLVISLDNVQEVRAIATETVISIIAITYKIGKEIYDIWKEVNNDSSTTDTPMFAEIQQKEILSQISSLSRQITHLGDRIENVGSQTMATVLKNLSRNLKLELRLNDLADLVSRINTLHSRMEKYVNASEVEKQTLENFAETAVSHDSNSVISLLDRIFVFIGEEGEGLLDRNVLNLLHDVIAEANSEFCNMQQSPHQLLYNLYNTIALTELKGYAMTQFSYMLLKLYNKGNFTEEAKIMRENYQDRTNRIINIIKKVMASASKDLWNCDPKKYVNGENYLELTGLLQGYIENEVDLNGDGTCRENCAHYVYTRNHGCYKDRYCSKQRKCNGKIISCQYIDSDMWICPANEKSSRRYEYVEYENGRILGRKMNCPRGTTKVDSWWRWLFWHCSYCLCLCDEQGQKSDRYFNMRSVDSNVDKNRVITGLRFTKENRIIHLQIQEGELLPHGNINYDSVNWVPINKYGITDRYIYNGNDYHTLSWEQRAIDLDDLVAPEGHIVTGVRFRKIGTHLNFEIRTTPFNFTTGELINPQEKSVWIGNDNTDGNPRAPRREIKLRSPDVPIRSPSPSAPDSLHDTYLQFVNSDLDKDAAQTTVPFIDSQPVMSQIPVPLSGAGIYHKGQFGFGGFIAPKLITYDYTKHMHSAFPSDEIIH